MPWWCDIDRHVLTPPRLGGYLDLHVTNTLQMGTSVSYSIFAFEYVWGCLVRLRRATFGAEVVGHLLL
jgi:hypothetical protein